jgi:hypothetical protein
MLMGNGPKAELIISMASKLITVFATCESVSMAKMLEMFAGEKITPLE